MFQNLELTKINTREMQYFSTRENKSLRKLLPLKYLLFVTYFQYRIKLFFQLGRVSEKVLGKLMNGIHPLLVFLYRSVSSKNIYRFFIEEIL